MVKSSDAVPQNFSADKPTPKKRERRKIEYSGSRWTGFILLVITAIVSLIFYLRTGAADFFSALFSPAKYSIQK